MRKKRLSLKSPEQKTGEYFPAHHPPPVQLAFYLAQSDGLMINDEACGHWFLATTLIIPAGEIAYSMGFLVLIIQAMALGAR